MQPGAHEYRDGQVPSLLAARPSSHTPFVPIAASNGGLSFSYCHGLRRTVISRVNLHMHTAPVDRVGRCVVRLGIDGEITWRCVALLK